MLLFDIRRVTDLSETELPDLSRSVDESLQDVTSELDTRTDNLDTPKQQHRMVRTELHVDTCIL